jgi:hypothetical protein
MVHWGVPPQLVINGRAHVSADQAARLSGLSRNYVCRLARRGALAGQKIAGGWLVEWQGVRTLIAQRPKKGST